VVIPAPEPVVKVAEPAPAIVDAVAQIAEPLVTPPAIELSAIEPVAPQESFLQGAVDAPEVEEMVVAPVEVPAAAPVDLGQTLAESGLVLVQTTAAAAVAQPEPPVKLGRPRKLKAEEVTEEASLVMVETQK
jgi:ribonuclease E